MREINAQLRSGKDIKLDAVLQVGGAGEIVLKSENKAALRMAKFDRRNSTRMQGIDLDESKPVAEQLRAALKKNSMKVVTLFKEWDDDESGSITKKEFRRGMREMGLEFPPDAMDELFNEWDPDGSGELSLRELSKQLRRGSGKTTGKVATGKATKSM